MPTLSPRSTDPAALAAKNRSRLFAYIATFVAAATGPDKSVEINKVSVCGAKDSAYTHAWQVTAHAICSDPIPGLVAVARTSVVDSARRDEAAVAHARQRAFVLASLVCSRKAGDSR
jgi:hypothetical protein